MPDHMRSHLRSGWLYERSTAVLLIRQMGCCCTCSQARHSCQAQAFLFNDVAGAYEDGGADGQDQALDLV